MKIRDKKLVIVLIEDSSVGLREIMSYNTLRNILDGKVKFWTDDNRTFHSVYQIKDLFIKFDYLEDVEKLIELEENNEEAELIVAKRKLIYKLEDEKKELDPSSGWDNRYIKLIDTVTEELKGGINEI